MKKYFFSIAVVGLLLSVSACKDTSTTETPSVEVETPVIDTVITEEVIIEEPVIIDGDTSLPVQE